MPTRKRKVKKKTSLDKINRYKSNGHLKSTEQTIRGRVKDTGNASLVPSPSVCQQRSEKLSTGGNSQLYVPVVSKTDKVLMPTFNWRADELIAKGKALRRFKAGIFYIQLVDREDGKVQSVVCGIDPGSKREAFTVKSESHTYLNILSDAVTWVKDRLKTRREMRRGRRFRKTPCRQNKSNQSRSPFPPSTKSRWQAKLRIVNILKKLYPISHFVVEDIAAKTKKGAKKWNTSFSPLEVGKQWFYTELGKIAEVDTISGFETYTMRNEMGLKKTKSKMEESFDSHNVDSWILANWYVGGHTTPDNQSIHRLIPIQFHRRQLHRFQPKEGIRLPYGGTMSLGLKRGSLIIHKKYGLSYVGGNIGDRTSLHDIGTGKRLTQSAKLVDISLLAYNTWRYNSFSSPVLKRFPNEKNITT